MNVVPSEDRQEVKGKFPGQVSKEAVLRFGVYVILGPAVLFLAAGRLNWLMGWVYVGMSIASTIISRIIVLRKYPELLAERGRFTEAEDIKGWDRVVGPLVALYGPMVTLIIAGLDVRFGWLPAVPFELQIVALLIVALGYALAIWAMIVNKFFSAAVRIQKDRGHTVVTAGPYRFLRHPSYAGGIVAYLATPVLLDALWALIPAGLTVVGVIVRTALEDRVLLAELDGYAEYAQQTRYRLVPGIW